jgi:sulfite reductase alpha subunit-like flavoprotein
MGANTYSEYFPSPLPSSSTACILCRDERQYHSWTDAIYRDRISYDRADIRELFVQGAKVYLCGSPALADGVKKACIRLYAEEKNASEEDAQEWFKDVESQRFATDVFA